MPRQPIEDSDSIGRNLFEGTLVKVCTSQAPEPLVGSPGPCLPRFEVTSATLGADPGLHSAQDNFVLELQNESPTPKPPMTSSPPSHTRARTWLGAALRLGASGLILALLFHSLPFEQLLEAVERVPLALWLTALGGYLAAHAIGVLQWRLMINLAGAELSFLQAAQGYVLVLCATLFLPSIVGGDVVRLGLALRLARNRAGAVLGSVFDRLLDLTALVGVAAAGAIWLHSSLNAQSRKIFWMVAGGGTLVLVGLLTVLTFFSSRRVSFWNRRQFARRGPAGRAILGQAYYVGLGVGV